MPAAKVCNGCVTGFHNEKWAINQYNPLFLLVPEAGLEPARSFEQRILSPQRLPIPPPGQDRKEMEARVGIEPAYTELQSAA